MTTFHAFLLAQHQFCNISGSYLEGHNKRHHASVTPAVCPASKEQPLPNASLSTQGSCPSFPCSGKNTSIFAPEWSITEWLHNGHGSPKHPSISVLITSAKKSLPLNCKMGLGIWQRFRIWGEVRDHCFGSGLGGCCGKCLCQLTTFSLYFLFQSVEPWAFAKNSDCSWLASKSKPSTCVTDMCSCICLPQLIHL